MRMLVLGAGLQGTACAYDLLTRTGHDVVIADIDVQRLPELLQPYLGGRLTAVQVDAGKPEAMLAVMEGADATMSALPYYFNLAMARAAIAAGSHFCDLGGNTEIVLEQKRLHEQAVLRGVSLVPDSGLAPGMVNILADCGIRRLDRPRAVRIKVGGLPQHPDPPLNYQVVYSLEGVLDYYTTRSWVLRDGEPLQVESLSEVEQLELEGVGELEAFHTAGGLSTMAQRYHGRLDSMEYKTLRYPGHADIVRAIRDLGLLSLDPVEVSGGTVVPRDVFIACAEPRLRKPEEKDLVALRVEAEGRKNGKPHRVVFDLVDYHDSKTGITAMERTTGFSLSITGQMQARGQANAAGVLTPDLAIPAGPYMDELRRRNVDIRRRDA